MKVDNPYLIMVIILFPVNYLYQYLLFKNEKELMREKTRLFWAKNKIFEKDCEILRLNREIEVYQKILDEKQEEDENESLT